MTILIVLLFSKSDSQLQPPHLSETESSDEQTECVSSCTSTNLEVFEGDQSEHPSCSNDSIRDPGPNDHLPGTIAGREA